MSTASRRITKAGIRHARTLQTVDPIGSPSITTLSRPGNSL